MGKAAISFRMARASIRAGRLHPTSTTGKDGMEKLYAPASVSKGKVYRQTQKVLYSTQCLWYAFPESETWSKWNSH